MQPISTTHPAPTSPPRRTPHRGRVSSVLRPRDATSPGCDYLHGWHVRRESRSPCQDDATGRDQRDLHTPYQVRRCQGQIGYRDHMTSLEVVVDHMTSLEVVVVMAGVPLTIMVVIGLLTLRPHFARTRRWRPDQEWNYGPVLFTTTTQALRDRSPTHPTTGGSRGGAQGNW